MNIEHKTAAVLETTTNSASESLAKESGHSAATAVSGNQRAEIARLVRDGITAAKARDLFVARAILQRAVEMDSRHETALMWLASISDKPLELLGYLQRVLEINPANERAAQWEKATKSLLAKSAIQQGAASHKEGMPEIAAEYFLRATEYEPTNETAWLWLVAVSSEPEDKLSYLNRVLNLNPQHEKALALFHKTKTQIARSLLKKGNSAFLVGDYDTACEILRDVMEYNPNLDEAWILQATLARSSEEKRVCYQKALELNPANEAAKKGLDALLSEEISEADLPAPESFAVEESAAHFAEVQQPFFETETLIEDDAPEQPFCGDRYVALESIDETNLESDLTSAAGELPPDDVSAAAAPEIAETHVFAPAAETEVAETETSSAVVAAAAALVEFAAEEENAKTTAAEKSQEPETLIVCEFCQAETPENHPRCVSCGAFYRLENFEQLLMNELNNEQKIREFIEVWQTTAGSRELTATENFNLGLAYLNLRNVKKAIGNLEQVMKTDAESAAYSERIAALLTWIEENMPEVLGKAEGRSGKTIMVVDDSPTVRKLIIGKLEKHGHKVVAAVDGMDALSKINDITPDLILLDVTMPRLDGYQLCKLVKSNPKTKHVPVVMISGKDGFFDKVRGRMAGSTAYITKPFGPETLLQTVETYCG
jgi:CheY-like chemotaxis protein